MKKEETVNRIIEKLIKLDEIRRKKQGISPALPSRSDSR